MRGERLGKPLRNASSIPDLFALAFEHAANGLSGPDLAVLRRNVVMRDTRALGWMPADKLDELFDFLAVLRQRDDRTRYRVRVDQRNVLADILGAPTARIAFVLAAAIDEVFDSFLDDAPRVLTRDGRDRAIAACASPFDDIDNPAPPLGQMTPLAICRGWMRRFHFTGALKPLRMFGRLPTFRESALPRRTRLALRAAADERTVRIAVVTTPRITQARTRTTAPGVFVVEPSWPARTETEFHAWLDHVASAGAHLCVVPECSTTGGELRSLQAALRARGSRFPSLVAVGLVHASRGEGHVNEAVLLSASGDEILRHEKLEPYTNPRGEMEDIVPRQSEWYDVVDTPLGRLAVNICRDMRSDVPSLLNRIFGVAVLLVPAWSKSLAFATDEARMLGARQRALTVVANAWDGHSEELGLVYAPYGSREALREIPRDRTGEGAEYPFDPVEPGPATAAIVFSYEARATDGTLRLHALPHHFV